MVIIITKKVKLKKIPIVKLILVVVDVKMKCLDFLSTCAFTVRRRLHLLNNLKTTGKCVVIKHSKLRFPIHVKSVVPSVWTRVIWLDTEQLIMN